MHARSDFIQGHYPDEFNHCYGCGQLNANGLQLRSYWDGQVAVCHFEPREEHIAFPGVIYGGLIASLIDCHSIGTACAALAHAASGGDSEASVGSFGPDLELPRCVTASLSIDYLKPTPAGEELLLRAHAEEVSARKAIVECTLEVAGVVTARGKVVGVKLSA